MSRRAKVWLALLFVCPIVAVCMALLANAAGFWVLIFALIAVTAVGARFTTNPIPLYKEQRRQRQAELSARAGVPIDRQVQALVNADAVSLELAKRVADNWRLAARSLRVNPDQMRWDDRLSVYQPLPVPSLGGDFSDFFEDFVRLDGTVDFRTVLGDEPAATCAACKYPLPDLASTLCPECGRRNLRLTTLGDVLLFVSNAWGGVRLPVGGPAA